VPFGAPSASSARLLRATDMVCFQPAANFAGTSTLTFRAWDQTAGADGATADTTAAGAAGGSGAFSVATQTATALAYHLNHAPVLAVASPSLPPVARSATAPAGVTVAQLLGTAASDPDGTAPGIAVFATVGSAANGGWQYSTDGGVTWRAVGPVATTAARLLRPTDRVRFVPAGAFSGVAYLGYLAWDGTQGTAGGFGNVVAPGAMGGSGAYSLTAQAASVTVT
jgi:hypothetical protein